jgi:hypothetical protein
LNFAQALKEIFDLSHHNQTFAQPESHPKLDMPSASTIAIRFGKENQSIRSTDVNPIFFGKHSPHVVGEFWRWISQPTRGDF